MNIPLLRSVQEAIRKAPETCDVSHWACGTTACIAGHAVLQAYPDARFVSSTLDLCGYLDAFESVDARGFIGEEAERLLGLNSDEHGRLFHALSWPKPFRLYDLHPGTPAYAERVCAFIDWFIETEQAKAQPEIPALVGQEA